MTNLSSNQQIHHGDPCVKCGHPHDDVPPGPCRGKIELFRRLLTEKAKGWCDTPLPGMPYPEYACGKCWTCRVRAVLAESPDETSCTCGHDGGSGSPPCPVHDVKASVSTKCGNPVMVGTERYGPCTLPAGHEGDDGSGCRREVNGT